MSAGARVADALLEATVVGGFSRLGFRARRRLFGWVDLDRIDLTGRIILVTGGTSGIGRAAAGQLARMGASVRILARNPARAATTCAEIVDATGNADVASVIADMADLDQVRRAGAELVATEPRLDAVVHNAGALSAERLESPQGHEATFAAQVLGPFLLSAQLAPMLRAAPAGRLIWVTSGGMYSERLDVERLEMPAATYDGVKAYARAKRAQVALTQSWAERFEGTDVVVHAMHPGWADTPGVRTSLPGFRRVTAPILRTPDEGADTVVWLAAADEPLASTGRLWLDRRPRSLHRVPWTRRADEADERERLWQLCTELTGAPLSPTKFSAK